MGTIITGLWQAWRAETGAHFSFSLIPWFNNGVSPVRKILLPTLVIAIPVVLMAFWFVFDAQSTVVEATEAR
jgi:hypothetical protein